MLSVHKQAQEEICSSVFKTSQVKNTQLSLFVLCGGVITLALDESSMGLHMMYDTLQKWLFSDIKHVFELWSAHS